MSSSRPWYKRYPADFIAGTLQLSLEEKGAYSIVIDLMFDRGGPIPDDPRWIARVCGCSTRKWKQIRLALIAAGKITCSDGLVSNDRVIKMIFSSEKEHLKFVESGAKGAEKTNEKRRQSREDNELEKKGPKKTNRHTRSQRLEEEPNGSSKSTKSVDFDLFWKAFPNKVGKKAAQRAWKAAKDKPPLPEILAALERYIATKPGDRAYCNPATWLNQGRWDDEHNEPSRDNGKPNSAHETLYDGFAAAASRLREGAGSGTPSDDRPGDAAGSAGIPSRDGILDEAGGHKPDDGQDCSASGALLDPEYAVEFARGGSPGLGGVVEGSAVERHRGYSVGMGQDAGAPPDAGRIPQAVKTVH